MLFFLVCGKQTWVLIFEAPGEIYEKISFHVGGRCRVISAVIELVEYLNETSFHVGVPVGKAHGLQLRSIVSSIL
jgi:hypothetical protein